MADDISLIVGVDYSELTGLVNTTSQTKRALGLMAKEFANSGSQKNYMAGINKLVAAQKNLDKSSRMSRSAIMKLGNQMRQEVNFTNALTGATKNLGVGLNQTKRGTNQLGVMMQQTGYQVGDFAVQVQSGTNFMVAFGQQATQLVGTMAMFAKTTKMIALFSGLGIAIPILSAVGAGLLRARKEAKSFESSTFDINEAAKNATEELRGYREELALLASEYKTLGEVGLDKQISNAQKELDDLLLSRQKILAGAKTSFGAEGATSGVEEMVNAALNERTAEMSAQIRAKKEQLRLLVQERESLERLKEVTGDINSLVEDGRVANLERKRTSRQAVIDMQSELNLQQKIAKYGAESLEVARYRAEQEAIVKNLTTESAKKYVELAVESYKVQTQINASADSAKSLSDALKEAVSAMSSLAGFSGSLDKALTVSIAKVQALKAGANEVVAGTIAGMRSELESRVSATSATGVDRSIVEAMYGGDRSKISQLEASLSEEKRLQEANRASSGSGAGSSSKKSSAEEFKEYLDGLKQQAELEKQLVGLFGEKRAEEEAVIKARQKYGEEAVAKQEAELRGTLRQTAAQKELDRVVRESRQQQEGLADSIASSFGDAFTSVVDGTKSMGDAFRDMAKDIIKQLFEILVVQRLVGSAEQGKESGIAGFLVKGLGAMMGGGTGGSSLAPAVPSANGNVLSNGIIQAYANGGVVGGPTYFPMAGGKTGLMGEAGPEAIMPLKRGANGKLGVQTDGGSQGNVVVNQSFNFSANGDDSVKKLIAQAAPQIANMTKQSMMNERRRGGQMKATFG